MVVGYASLSRHSEMVPLRPETTPLGLAPDHLAPHPPSSASGAAPPQDRTMMTPHPRPQGKGNPDAPDRRADPQGRRGGGPHLHRRGAAFRDGRVDPSRGPAPGLALMLAVTRDARLRQPVLLQRTTRSAARPPGAFSTAALATPPASARR